MYAKDWVSSHIQYHVNRAKNGLSSSYHEGALSSILFQNLEQGYREKKELEDQ